jgi:hypothetical protein
LFFPRRRGIWDFPRDLSIYRRATMKKLNELWIRYGTPRNRKVLYIVLALSTLAVAGGAPGAGSGTGGFCDSFDPGLF